MPLDILIEGLLFYKSAPQKKTSLLKLYSVSPTELKTAIAHLKNRLEAGATRLIETENEITLATAPTLAPFIEQIRKADIKSDIGKAGAETLAIVLYRGPVSRSEIDRVRGVNSSFILRNLLIRGLIERSANSKGSGYSFAVTPALLAQLGVSDSTSLPEFARITDALEIFEHHHTVAETSS
jgi:segregation and condensation protein B